MTAIDIYPAHTSTDRLGIALLFATVIHGLAILGIAFGVNFERPSTPPQTLDIVLVQTQSEQAPEEAEHIAQENQLASGTTEVESAPTSPVTSLDPRPITGTAPVRMQASAPRTPKTTQTQVLVAEDSPTTVASELDTHQEEQEEEITGEELIDRSLEIARLVAELSEQQNRYSQRPRVHYISATSAKSVVEASYLEAWVRKVETVGKLNYPEEADRRCIRGKLILNVLLNRHGQVVRMELGSSSGHKVLDDAAFRIVELSAPFGEFPPEMRKAYDQLMITRTWIFSDHGLITE